MRPVNCSAERRRKHRRVMPLFNVNYKNWPGLPRGTKFDPSDEELMWHLLAEIGEGDTEPHPFIFEFILPLGDDDGDFFPDHLPGVRQDGCSSYFFHRSFKSYGNIQRSRKRRKMVDGNLGSIYWHKIGKSKPVYVDGAHKGSKKIMIMYKRDGEAAKPEKTNWVMHQYYVGSGEEAVGEIVVSKIFYQLKSRISDRNLHEPPLDAAEAVGMDAEPAVAAEPIGCDSHAWDYNPTSTEVPSQAICQDNDNIQAEKSNASKCCGGNSSFPIEGSMRRKIQSQLQVNGNLAFSELVQQRYSCTSVLEDSVMNNHSEDEQPRENTCNNASEGETINDLLNSSHSTDGSQVHLGSSQMEADFHISNMPDLSGQSDHATHVKVEASNYMQENQCHAATIQLSSESATDEVDHGTLQERYKLMPSCSNNAVGCHYSLKHNQVLEQCDTRPAWFIKRHGKNSGVVPETESAGALIDGLETNVSVPENESSRSSIMKISSIRKCVLGGVKDEIQPDDRHSPREECQVYISQHDDAGYIANLLTDSPPFAVSESPRAADKGLSSPNCLNCASFDAVGSDENEGKEVGKLLRHICYPDFGLPATSREPVHMNLKSQPDSLVAFPVQIKSEPLEDYMVGNSYETNHAVQYDHRLFGICSPDTDSSTFSSRLPQCFPQATCLEDPSSAICQSQQFQNESCKYSDGGCISGSRQTGTVKELVQQNGNNHPSNTILSVSPPEVKVEPFKECNTESIPENNTKENSSTSPEEVFKFCSSLPSLVPSSHPISPKHEQVENGLLGPCQDPPSILQEIDIQEPLDKLESTKEIIEDLIDHVPLRRRMEMLASVSIPSLFGNNMVYPQKTTLHHASLKVESTKTSSFSVKKKRKKTATDSVETALEEDAPGLLQVLIDKGITTEEIKLYGDAEDDEVLPISSSEDSFEELETIIAKLFSEGPSIFKFPSVRQIKGSKAVYCLACLISLIEQARYLRFRQSPVEWGWCRDLQSFIFVFERHNRIVLERPEYGYATYFFELVESLPIHWQIKRLVTAMKLPCCSRTILLENKPLLAGEDLTEGEARVMEEYGWTRNSGLGTMLNYCDRVVHDRRNERYSMEWKSKIGKLLMRGHDSGRIVLSTLPKKVADSVGHKKFQVWPDFFCLETQSSEVKLESFCT